MLKESRIEKEGEENIGRNREEVTGHREEDEIRT